MNADRLLHDFSLEMTGKDLGELAAARGTIPPGTRINITFLAHEDSAVRLVAATAVRAAGFVPVPHLSARRLASRQTLEEFLAALQAAGVSDEVFVVGGDPADPHGPYPDSLSIIESGLLERYGVRRVSIAGHPEGHPGIPDGVLWDAVADKSAALARHALGGDIITQFGFDADPVLDWIAALRERGLHSPVRVGVPGPAGAGRLIRYAARLGVGTGASIADLVTTTGTAGPGRFLRALATDYHPATHGEVKLHFYTFGGLRATSEWIHAYAKEH
ncbi:methylenetetrahydrofolate reductase [Actinoplanes sp. NPDC048796]|uniref:methylenetetrahydrofolate reductase n=1 Tax=Actinoplanes sp. NPDC048796 TaxID=3155640 RepID=UPI003406CD45